MTLVAISRRSEAVLHDHDGCLTGRVHPRDVPCFYDYRGTIIRCSPDGVHDFDLTGLEVS